MHGAVRQPADPGKDLAVSRCLQVCTSGCRDAIDRWQSGGDHADVTVE